ncbi:hypothetical protein [Oscillatoria salina]|uniref:hypothetical protein n=1 Tax=Oscillatoria salina TaxID=331517 RepID=UPI001CCC5AC1|nr:hypothetical protein [Oscillatoria salina]MBZ8181782.1 hypothetical protein [Oscillatoria salina IIICB1]
MQTLKNYKLWFLGLTLVTISFPTLATNLEIDSINRKSVITSQNSNTPNEQQLDRQILLEMLGKRRKGEPPRGDNFCAIAPNKVHDTFNLSWSETWSENPLFIWRGNASKIEVFSEDDSSEPIWSRNLTSQQQQQQRIFYQGEVELEPDKIFFLAIYPNGQTEISAKDRIPFTIMPIDEQHNKIMTDLESLITAEEKIYYLLEKNLYWDAVREFVLSSETEEEIEDIRNKLCKEQSNN